MTDKQLAEIERDAGYDEWISSARVLALIAEVKRLQDIAGYAAVLEEESSGVTLQYAQKRWERIKTLRALNPPTPAASMDDAGVMEREEGTR